jgi:hypothetical protein
MTGHLAQGMTVDQAFVLGTDGVFGEWSYVALSRGRRSNRFYAVAAAPPERDEIAPRQPAPELVDELLAALARAREERMAIDIAAAASDLRERTEPELRREELALKRTPELSELLHSQRGAHAAAVHAARRGLGPTSGLEQLDARRAELLARVNAADNGVREQLVRYGFVRGELRRRRRLRAAMDFARAWHARRRPERLSALQSVRSADRDL